jgi:hypothetical protein
MQAKRQMAASWKYWKLWYRVVDFFAWFIWRTILSILLLFPMVIEMGLSNLVTRMRRWKNPLAEGWETELCHGIYDFFMFGYPDCRAYCFVALWERRIEKHSLVVKS